MPVLQDDATEPNIGGNVPSQVIDTAEIARRIIKDEYEPTKADQQYIFDDFEATVDMFDARRTEKEYSWESDVSLPDFASQMNTQTSIDVSQYFQTRDFCEVYVQDESEQAQKAAAAAKELINRTLNRRDLYHYHKYVRAKLTNHLCGEVYLKCWWEKETITEMKHVVKQIQQQNPYTGQITQIPVQTQEPTQRVVKDRFCYEVLDRRNVFVDPAYCYTLQDKGFIILRSETNKHDLARDAQKYGYFNLDKVAAWKTDGATETKRETFERDSPERTTYKDDTKLDKLERYGRFWVTPDGKPGVDKGGEPLPGAAYEECVATIVMNKGNRELIGLYKTPYADKDGVPYRPLIRGLCYIHPVRDGGVGDGKYARELQKAINDTFNISNDRTRLATIPTLRARRGSLENMDEIYIAPGHVMELDNPQDVAEFQISDNISGALQQISLLTNKMQEATSIYPTTMGNMPYSSSITATAISGAQQSTNTRTNYKAMTFEYTALCELYWMIQQMTWAFASPETGQKLMGDKVFDFDPGLDYYYKPLTQAIETEHAKSMKINRWTQILQTMAQVQHPDTIKVVNYILQRIAELDGDEYTNFIGRLQMDEQAAAQAQQQGNAEQVPGQSPVASNQNGVPQSQAEMMAREGGGM